MELALARVLPGVVGDQKAKGCHSCSIPESDCGQFIRIYKAKQPGDNLAGVCILLQSENRVISKWISINNRHPYNLANDQKHLHANGEGKESCQPALAFILLIVAIPEQGWFLSTYFRTVHFAYQASAQECAKSTIRTSWMRMKRNPPIMPKYIHTWTMAIGI